jgi:hypothetical protein
MLNLTTDAAGGTCYRAGVGTDTGQTLTVTAREVTERKFDPSAYPYRHLAVVQVAKIGTPDSPDTACHERGGDARTGRLGNLPASLWPTVPSSR